MRRSRSGQVLVAAATLMLAVLLVSAMSIPVINTDIEPSSQIFNVVRVTISNAVEDLITYMSAYQCASTIVKKKQSLDFSYIVKTQYERKILDKVWAELQSAAMKDRVVAKALQNLKSLKVEVESAYLRASAGGWGSDPGKAGTVEIQMRLNIRVTFKWWDNKPTKIIFWMEEVHITSNSIGTKVEGMFPWQGVKVLDEAIGFVPILGAISGNVHSIKPEVYLNVVFYITGATEEYINKTGGLSKIQSVVGSSDSKILESRMLVGLLSPRKVTKTGPNFIQWEEHSHIDYAGLAIGILLDLIPWKKLSQAAVKLPGLIPKTKLQPKEFVEYAVETKYNPNNFFIQRVGKSAMDYIYEKSEKQILTEQGILVKEITETGGTSLELAYRNQKHFDQFVDALTREKLMGEGYNKLIQKEFASKTAQSGEVKVKKQVQQKFIDSFTKSLDELLGGEGGKRGAELGEGGFIYGPAEITFTPNQAGGKKPAYFDSQDPLLFVALPLHAGNALFAACVWIDGVHPRK
jgi:hypothetical protein